MVQKLYFNKIRFSALTTKLKYLPETCRGATKDLDEVHPLKDKINPKKLFCAKSKVSAQGQLMYMRDPKAEKTVMKKIDEFGRKVQPVDLNGECAFAAFLKQIAHLDRYKPEDLRHQTAYYMAKYPEVFEPHFSNWFQDESMESFIINMFNGRRYGDVCAFGVIGVMWNIKITIIHPDLENIKIFHNSYDPDVVLVHNGRDGLEGHYSATIPLNKKCHAIRGDNYSSEIRELTNLELLETQAKDHRDKVIRTQLEEQFKDNCEILDIVHDKIKALKIKCEEMEQESRSISAKQTLISARLLTMGIDCSKYIKEHDIQDVSQNIEAEQPDTASASASTSAADPETSKPASPPLPVITTKKKVDVLPEGAGYGIIDGQKKFFCKTCEGPKTFTNKADLLRHFRDAKAHSTEKKWKCGKCSKVFQYKQQRKEHLHEKHLFTFCYWCEKCGKGFYKNGKVVHHRKSCTGAKFTSPSRQPSAPKSGQQDKDKTVEDMETNDTHTDGENVMEVDPNHLPDIRASADFDPLVEVVQSNNTITLPAGGQLVVVNEHGETILNSVQEVIPADKLLEVASAVEQADKKSADPLLSEGIPQDSSSSDDSLPPVPF